MISYIRRKTIGMLSGVYRWSLSTNRLHGIRVPEHVLPFVAFLLRLIYWSVRTEKRWLNTQRKLRVIFVVSDVTKWKGQTVYDKMLASNYYDPYVMPTILDGGFFRDTELLTRYLESVKYHSELGLRILHGYDICTGRCIPICDYRPDIVIYIQPWGIDLNQGPIAASEMALTFYLPYGVAAIGDDVYEFCKMPFLRLVYAQFVQSEACAKFYRSQRGLLEFGCLFLGVGCPHFEVYKRNGSGNKKCVIYAPHWSFKHDKNLSRYYMGTFLEMGQYVLELAKKHPEVHWIFRPHPGLRTKLLSTGAMSESEVEAYYLGWASIGETSYSGEYFPLFEKSTAMITDCVTFLTEYLLTENPLIRLVASTCPQPIPPVRRLFDAFYDVHSSDELEGIFDSVIIKGKDPMRNIRLQVAKDMGCMDRHATDRVMDNLNKIFHK